MSRYPDGDGHGWAGSPPARKGPVIARITVLIALLAGPLAAALTTAPAAFADTGTAPYVQGLNAPAHGGYFTDDQGNTCAGAKCLIGYGNGKTVDLVVTFTPHPAKGWQFNGWKGSCSGPGSCQVKIAGDTSTPNYVLQATFAKIPAPSPTPTPTPLGSHKVSVSVLGPGSVTSNAPGLSCATACAAIVKDHSQVTITEQPDPGAVFLGWAGDCAASATQHTCMLTVLTNVTVIARFARRSPLGASPAIIAPGHITAGQMAAFQVRGPALLHGAGTYYWDFEQTGRQSPCAASHPVAYHIFTHPGQFVVTLTTGTGSGMRTARTTVYVGGQAPRYPHAVTAASDIACSSTLQPTTTTPTSSATPSPSASASPPPGALCVQELDMDTMRAIALDGCIRSLYVPVSGSPGQFTIPTAPPAAPPLGRPLTSTPPPGSQTATIHISGAPHPTQVNTATLYAISAQPNYGLWQADGRIDLNGLDLAPVGGTAIRLAPWSDYISAQADVTLHGSAMANNGQPITLGHDIALDGSLADAVGGGSVIPVGAMPAGGQQTLWELPLLGTAQVTFTDTGSADVSLNVGLPSAFHDVRLGTVSGTASVSVDPSGLLVHDASIQAANIDFRVFQIKSASLSFAETAHGPDGGVLHNVWNAAFSITFGLNGDYGGIDAGAVIADGQIVGFTIGAEFPGDGIPIYAATHLTEVSVNASFNPVLRTLASMGGTIQFTWGAKVPVPGGHDVPTFELDGGVQYNGGDPWQLAFTAMVQIVGIPLADAAVLATGGSSGWGIELTADIHADLLDRVLQLRAAIDGGFFCPTGQACQWMVDIGGQACLLGLCLGAEGLISSAGIGVCGSVHIGPWSWEPGVGATWGQPPVFMSDGCSLDPWRVSLSPVTRTSAGGTPPAGQQVVLAAAHAPAGGTAVVFPAGKSQEVVAVRGMSAPPSVTITGPDGQTITAAAKPGVPQHFGRYLVLTSPTDHTMYILVAQPPAGQYTLTPTAGSAAIAMIEYAAQQPAANVTAHVTSGPSSTDELHYAYTDAPGRTVKFLESGKGDITVLGNAAATQGILSFTPPDGAPGTRTIYAAVFKNGKPVSRTAVAHYIAPGRQLPKAPLNPRVSYARSGLDVTWQPPRGGQAPYGYAVIARFASGRANQYLLGPNARFVRVPAVYRDEHVRLTIVGLLADGTPGAAVTIIFPRPPGTGSASLLWFGGIGLLAIAAATPAGLIYRRRRSQPSTGG